jgi:hypothetical protein
MAAPPLSPLLAPHLMPGVRSGGTRSVRSGGGRREEIWRRPTTQGGDPAAVSEEIRRWDLWRPRRVHLEGGALSFSPVTEQRRQATMAVEAWAGPGGDTSSPLCGRSTLVAVVAAAWMAVSHPCSPPWQWRRWPGGCSSFISLVVATVWWWLVVTLSGGGQRWRQGAAAVVHDFFIFSKNLC